MNGNIKKYIYMAGAIFIAVVALTILFKLLKWIILAGIIIYIITKVVGFIKQRNDGKELSDNNVSEGNTEYIYEEETENYSNGQIIDVEYEDVDDKEK